MSLKLLKDNILERPQWLVGLLALAAAALVLVRIASLGLLTVLTDELAHLNFARSLFDSSTPGISQIGFWPPLLHLLLAPFTAIPVLYDTGLAGAMVLVPFFIMGGVFLYLLLFKLTRSKSLSFFSSLLFLFNPYVLYYSVTPMMEILFLSNLFAVAYFVVSWLQEDKLKYLLWAAVFTALAGLSRYEGFVLIPVLIAVFVIQTLLKRKSRSELQATLIVYLFVAIIGVVAVMGFSWFYSGNPLSFAGGDWIREPSGEVFPAKQNIIASVRYFLHASYYMVGQPLVLISMVSFALLLLFLRRRFEAIAALLVLVSPLVLVIFAVYGGSYSISVPDLPPFTLFVNERYALTWIGFLILVPALLAAYMINAARNNRLLFNASLSAAGLLMTALLYFTASHFYDQAVAGKFYPVALNSNRPLTGQVTAARYLNKNYDFGKILLTRADNDPVLAEADLPLKNYIYEGNHLYFGQAVEEPWLFARWVIMHNPENETDAWAKENERISRKWGESEQFRYYYTLVSENAIRRIYKINDARVAGLAAEKGWNRSQIPSINSKITHWSPEDVYDRIKNPAFALETEPQTEDRGFGILKMIGLKAFDIFGLGKSRDPVSKEEVRKSLPGLYRTELKPDYERGFFVDEQKAGTSESQSYALLQSYWTGDKKTFERVWNWTLENIKRPDDNLFSWRFSEVDSRLAFRRRGIIISLERVYEIKIEDVNSATDADADIAYALLKAGEDWGREDYLEAGTKIASDIWQKETGVAAGMRIVTAGNWAESYDKLYFNPSYFAPYEYRLFARYDHEHDWNKLINDSYDLLGKVLTSGPLSQYRLPPNWIEVDKNNLALSTFRGNPDSDNYTYDAFRTFWRVSLDQVLNPNIKAEQILGLPQVFRQQYERGESVCTIYRRANGTYQCQFAENLLASPLAVFAVTEEELAKKMISQYYLDGDVRLPEDSFFSKSWHWFGLALYASS